MTKEKKVYYLLIVSFILFISVFISVFLVKNINFEGKTIIKRKYYEVIYSTYNDRLSVKDDVISVRLNNLEDETYFVITNAGNMDAIVKNVSIDTVNTNLNKEELNVNLNLKNGDFIKGGESKKVNININYNPKIEDNMYLDLKIKYTFEE